tara:strand:- start:20 stop:1018 length:999 start_codon:yes stop_codon:yes gene_type:complete
MLTEQPHRRFNPLTGDWVLVSPHRTKRPWQGAQETVAKNERPQHDATCYLCPRNERANGEHNPDYANTYVFTNDFAALLPEGDSWQTDDELLTAQSANGTCRVMCFSPRHDLTLADMDEADIVSVINTWQTQVTELSESYQWVQVFENKGAAMGCSNPHPHGQIWASDFIPNEAEKEDIEQHNYVVKNQSNLLIDYALLESEKQERVVCENDDWIVVVPFWAVWPYETLLLPKFAIQHLPDLTTAQCQSLAAILKTLLQKYDALFDCSFPYSMGWHGAPFNGDDNSHWQLHAHFYPPLLRSASVKKFMVGYEMLAESQRDITAEQAAETLRA